MAFLPVKNRSGKPSVSSDRLTINQEKGKIKFHKDGLKIQAFFYMDRVIILSLPDHSLISLFFRYSNPGDYPLKQDSYSVQGRKKRMH